MPHQPRINTETADKSKIPNTSSSKKSSKSLKQSSKKKKTATKWKTSPKWSNLRRDFRRIIRNANNTGNKKKKIYSGPNDIQKQQHKQTTEGNRTKKEDKDNKDNDDNSKEDIKHYSNKKTITISKHHTQTAITGTLHKTNKDYREKSTL